MLVHNIETLCREHGMSVSQLERELNISLGTIRTWRKRSPNLSTLLKVTTRFQVPIDQLLRTDVQIEKGGEQDAGIDDRLKGECRIPGNIAK